jgi:hypothetical protein
MKTSPILDQIRVVWSLLRQPDTSDTFLQALNTLWLVLTRLVLLLFLIMLLVVATAVWLWGAAFQNGRSYREWLNTNPTPSQEAFLARLGQDILTFFQGLGEFSGAIARKLLGIQDSTTGTLPKTLAAAETSVAGFINKAMAKETK